MTHSYEREKKMWLRQYYIVYYYPDEVPYLLNWKVSSICLSSYYYPFIRQRSLLLFIETSQVSLK